MVEQAEKKEKDDENIENNIKTMSREEYNIT